MPTDDLLARVTWAIDHRRTPGAAFAGRQDNIDLIADLAAEVRALTVRIDGTPDLTALAQRVLDADVLIELRRTDPQLADALTQSDVDAIRRAHARVVAALVRSAQNDTAHG